MLSALPRSWIGPALLVAAACGPPPPEAAARGGASAPSSGSPASEAPRRVRTVAAVEKGWERVLHATGELLARDEATLSTKVPGRLERLEVDLGSQVGRGDVVARIEGRDYELRVTQAEASLAGARALLGLTPEQQEDHVDPASTAIVRGAQAELDEARRERDRLLELARRGVSAQADLDRIEARLQRAESAMQDAQEMVRNRQALVAQRRAELAIARQQLADTKILAPFDGAVTARLAGTGDYLTAGAPVARLVLYDPLRLRLEISERDAAGIELGQTVRVTVEGSSEPITCAVARTSPAIRASNRTLVVEADLPNPSGALRPGSFARAQIVVDPAARALVVPTDALKSFAGIDKVVVIEDGKAAERRVVVGRRLADEAEILSGLEAGTQVVLSPGSLQQGSPVIAEP